MIEHAEIELRRLALHAAQRVDVHRGLHRAQNSSEPKDGGLDRIPCDFRSLLAIIAERAGRPGDGSGLRPERSDRRFRLFIATSSIKVLRRPVESAQYVSIKYTERLADAGIEPSVGSVGDSYDNALAETINGLYKAEVIHRRGPWRNFEAVEFATLEWVDWFNHRRLLEPIGNIPPAEAEARYYALNNQAAMAA